MIYFVALGLALLEITVGPHIHLFGGMGYYLPALMFASSANGAWREWGIWLLALGVTSFFKPISWLTLGLLIFLTLTNYFIFRHWIDEDNTTLKLLFELGILGLFITLVTFEALRSLHWLIVGSFLLSAPFIFLWHSLSGRK